MTNSEKKRFPTLCSWCNWCVSSTETPLGKLDLKHSSTYCLKDHFCNDGEDNYEDVNMCDDFEAESGITPVDIAWWAGIWAKKEADRLNTKYKEMTCENIP
jgi:hypothetical protein